LGLEVRAVFRDEGKSAKSTVGRDGLAAAMNECKRTGAALVVYKFDRLARNAADALTVRDALTASGARIISATEGEATASPMAKAIFGMASIFAELDNAQRAERSRRGMAARAEAGGWCFRAPLGFVTARSAAGVPILAPDEETAPAIREAYAALAAGEIDATGAVRRIMVETGCEKSTAYSALRSPLYAGRLPAGRLTGGKVREAAFPGLVDGATFDAAQLRLGSQKVGEVKMKENPLTPFVGVLHCAECGRRLVGGLSRGRHGGKFGYYRCLKCRGVSIPFADAEAQLRAGLEIVAASRDFLELVRANLRGLDAAECRAETERAELAAARRTISREEARLARAREAFVAGSFTLAEFDAFRTESEERLREARAVIVSREKWTERREEFIDALMVVARDPSAILRLPATPLRDALRALCGRVTVGKDKRLVFPEDSTVAVLRAIKAGGFDNHELAPRILARLNPDTLAEGLAAAVAALGA
jgi:DNA invertase Pin-like site-specific DNA recombinase